MLIQNLYLHNEEVVQLVLVILNFIAAEMNQDLQNQYLNLSLQITECKNVSIYVKLMKAILKYIECNNMF